MISTLKILCLSLIIILTTHASEERGVYSQIAQDELYSLADKLEVDCNSTIFQLASKLHLGKPNDNIGFNELLSNNYLFLLDQLISRYPNVVFTSLSELGKPSKFLIKHKPDALFGPINTVFDQHSHSDIPRWDEYLRLAWSHIGLAHQWAEEKDPGTFDCKSRFVNATVFVINELSTTVDTYIERPMRVVPKEFIPVILSSRNGILSEKNMIFCILTNLWPIGFPLDNKGLLADDIPTNTSGFINHDLFHQLVYLSNTSNSSKFLYTIRKYILNEPGLFQGHKLNNVFYAIHEDTVFYAETSFSSKPENKNIKEFLQKLYRLGFSCESMPLQIALSLKQIESGAIILEDSPLAPYYALYLNATTTDVKLKTASENYLNSRPDDCVFKRHFNLYLRGKTIEYHKIPSLLQIMVYNVCLNNLKKIGFKESDVPESKLLDFYKMYNDTGHSKKLISIDFSNLIPFIDKYVVDKKGANNILSFFYHGDLDEISKSASLKPIIEFVFFQLKYLNQSEPRLVRNRDDFLCLVNALPNYFDRVEYPNEKLFKFMRRHPDFKEKMNSIEELLDNLGEAIEQHNNFHSTPSNKRCRDQNTC